MPILVAAVVLVGLLCAVDLLLTFAVLRRLREHSEKLGRLPMIDESMAFDRGPLLGLKLPEFSTEAVRRAVASPESVTGNLELLGFFRPGCGPCHEQAPHFLQAARALGNGRALAVVTGSSDMDDDLVRMFNGVVDVVLEPTSDELRQALNIRAFPTFLRLDADGAVADAAVSVEELRSPANVAGLPDLSVR